MPLYTFECDNCGHQDQVAMTFEEHDEDRALGSVGCARCIRAGTRGRMMQVFGFHFNRGMAEHYSDQLDQHVTSERHFKSELSRQQDEYSQRMGFDVNFETVDPSDTAALNVTDAGLESSERAHHDATFDGHKSSFS